MKHHSQDPEPLVEASLRLHRTLILLCFPAMTTTGILCWVSFNLLGVFSPTWHAEKGKPFQKLRPSSCFFTFCVCAGVCTCGYVCVMHVEGRGCVPCLVQLFYLYFWGGASHWISGSLTGLGWPAKEPLSSASSALRWQLSVPMPDFHRVLGTELCPPCLPFSRPHLSKVPPPSPGPLETGFPVHELLGTHSNHINPEQRVYNGVVTLPGKVLGLGDGSELRTHTAHAEDHFC